MKPNWDDAPIEATHWCEAKHEWRDETEESIGDCCIRIPDTTPPAPEWDGRFPKVHTDCLMADDKGEFQEVRIISWVEGYVVGWCAAREQVYFSKDHDDFRPLRTKEQREREETVSAAMAVIKARGALIHTGHELAMEDLYDAGMLRKAGDE